MSRKNCNVGKHCGSTCISRKYTCHVEAAKPCKSKSSKKPKPCGVFIDKFTGKKVYWKIHPRNGFILYSSSVNGPWKPRT